MAHSLVFLVSRETQKQILPGEQAQVDWGNFGTSQEEGAWVKLYAFTFTLAWSG